MSPVAAASHGRPATPGNATVTSFCDLSGIARSRFRPGGRSRRSRGGSARAAAAAADRAPSPRRPRAPPGASAAPATRQGRLRRPESGGARTRAGRPGRRDRSRPPRPMAEPRARSARSAPRRTAARRRPRSSSTARRRAFATARPHSALGNVHPRGARSAAPSARSTPASVVAEDGGAEFDRVLVDGGGGIVVQGPDERHGVRRRGRRRTAARWRWRARRRTTAAPPAAGVPCSATSGPVRGATTSVTPFASTDVTGAAVGRRRRAKRATVRGRSRPCGGAARLRRPVLPAGTNQPTVARSGASRSRTNRRRSSAVTAPQPRGHVQRGAGGRPTPRRTRAGAPARPGRRGPRRTRRRAAGAPPSTSAAVQVRRPASSRAAKNAARPRRGQRRAFGPAGTAAVTV